MVWHVSVSPMQFLDALRVVASLRGFPRALALFAKSRATFPRRWVETGPFQRARFCCLKTDHPAMQKVRMRSVFHAREIEAWRWQQDARGQRDCIGDGI